MKRKWFHAKEDPLYLSLLLVVVLFFISVLAACFSFLVMSENRTLPAFDVWQQKTENKSSDFEDQGMTIRPEEIKVAQLSGEVVGVDENSITLRTVVYSGEKHEYTITLPDDASEKFNKFIETGQIDEDGLPQIKKQKFNFKELKAGDFVTFTFPLEVPISEIESQSLVIEEVIVNDEFNPSLVEE